MKGPNLKRSKSN